nr:conjugal transfer protein TraG [Vibrio vulnificus]
NDRWHDSVGKNLNYGEGSTTGFNTQVSQGMNKIQSAIDNVSKLTGWTTDQSRAYLQSAYAGVDVSVGGKLGPLGGSANAGVKWSDEERTAYSNMSSEQKQQLEQATKQYTEGANAITTAGTQVDNKDTRTSVEQFAHDFAINAINTKSLGASVMQSQSDLNALSNTQTRLESVGGSFTAKADGAFQNYLEKTAKLEQEDVGRLMTAYQPEDIADAKKHWQEFTRTEAFATIAGLDGDSARVVAKMNQDHQATTPTMPPSLTPEQSKTMENEWEKTQGAVDATRTAVMHNKGTGGLFNQDRFDGVTDNARQQQSQAQQSISKPEPIIALTIKSQVEAEVTKPERTEYVTSDQSYPAAPRYTQNPNK